MGLVLAGCSSTPSAPAPLGGSSSAAPTASPGALPRTDAETLAERASRGLALDYAARYRLRSQSGTASVTVSHRPDGLRLQIDSGGSVATLLVTSERTVACSGSGSAARCVLVAEGRAPIDPGYDAGAQRLFTDYLQSLVDHPEAYDVKAAVTQSPSGTGTAAGTGATSCWMVTPRTGAPEPVVTAGVYCFSGDGAPSGVTYPASQLTLDERLPAAGPGRARRRRRPRDPPPEPADPRAGSAVGAAGQVRTSAARPARARTPDPPWLRRSRTSRAASTAQPARAVSQQAGRPSPRGHPAAQASSSSRRATAGGVAPRDPTSPRMLIAYPRPSCVVDHPERAAGRRERGEVRAVAGAAQPGDHVVAPGLRRGEVPSRTASPAGSSAPVEHPAGPQRRVQVEPRPGVAAQRPRVLAGGDPGEPAPPRR